MLVLPLSSEMLTSPGTFVKRNQFTLCNPKQLSPLTSLTFPPRKRGVRITLKKGEGDYTDDHRTSSGSSRVESCKETVEPTVEGRLVEVGDYGIS